MKCREEGLYVCMLGGFSVSCGGKEVILGRRSTLKFIQLLQILWLWGENGVSKENLIEMLYDRIEISDANNSVNNLLHQVRKKLTEAGLPGKDYIICTDGVYRANPQIPVTVDVREFEQLIETAEQEPLQEADEAQRQRAYQQALDLYQGEMLPALSTELWVIERNLHLKQLFDRCVRWLGTYYRKEKNYPALDELYEKAVRLYPYDHWQIDQIDMLLERGDSRQPFVIYKNMVETYFDEMGLPPTPEMLACYERMSASLHDLPGDMETIKRGIQENVGSVRKGGYFCQYRGFIDICHIYRRNMARLGKSIFLMLCTLHDYEGKAIQNEEKLKNRSQLLEEAIGKSLREGDVYTKYSPSQYLILLMGTNQENCEIVYRRIVSRFKQLVGTTASVSYTVTSLAELQEPDR